MGSSALVLSGGGLFGAYQAGVWQALEPYFNPDMVVGASAGSLNGWAIASGMPAAELVRIWLDGDRFRRPRLRLGRSLFDGLIDNRDLESLIRDLHQRWQPRRRVGVALTRLWDLQPVLAEDGEITWEHLAASCGVPAFLKQYALNGRRYSDGGLLTPLPLWGAIQMGATAAVCVNVLEPGNRVLRQAGRLLRWHANFREGGNSSIAAVALDPPQALGRAHHMLNWDRGRVERWIDLGRRQAELHRDEIRAIARDKTFHL